MYSQDQIEIFQGHIQDTSSNMNPTQGRDGGGSVTPSFLKDWQCRVKSLGKHSFFKDICVCTPCSKHRYSQ